MTVSVSAASALPRFRRWRRLSNRWCALLCLRILLPPLPTHHRSSFLGSKRVVLGRNRSPGRRRGGCSHLEMAAHFRLEAGATSLKKSILFMFYSHTCPILRVFEKIKHETKTRALPVQSATNSDPLSTYSPPCDGKITSFCAKSFHTYPFL